MWYGAASLAPVDSEQPSISRTAVQGVLDFHPGTVFVRGLDCRVSVLSPSALWVAGVLAHARSHSVEAGQFGYGIVVTESLDCQCLSRESPRRLSR